MSGTAVAVKVGLSAAANSKTGKKIIGVLVGGLFLMMFMGGALVVSILSIFSDSGKVTKDFNAQSTAVYQIIRAAYDEYTEANIKDMEALSEQLIKENTVKETIVNEVYNPKTQKTEKKKETKEYCKATVTIKPYEYIRTAYTIAYLSVKHNKDYMKKKVKIDKDELIEFWNFVDSGVLVKNYGTEDAPNYFIYNETKSLEEILNNYFTKDKNKEEFKNSVFVISGFIGLETFTHDTVQAAIKGNHMDIPLYYQYASGWGKVKYGDGNIAKSGCAPTCIAMVLSYLKGAAIYPDDIVDVIGSKYYVKGTGSSWEIFEGCAKEWRIGCTNLGKSKESIINALSDGKPVILSVGAGTFTSSGHFIVLTGIDAEGYVTVNDPNDSSKKNFCNQKFKISQLMSEAKGAWSFE